jgi:ArsR family transcriptional regulator
MDLELSVAALSALAQSTRLEVFRLLVRNEPNGLPAGEIAKLLNVPHNTMSTHLNILSRTGLVSSERDGRSIVYRVDLSVVRGFFVYLLKDCCDGRPELCQPLLDDLTHCCQPTGAACA